MSTQDSYFFSLQERIRQFSLMTRSRQLCMIQCKSGGLTRMLLIPVPMLVLRHHLWWLTLAVLDQEPVPEVSPTRRWLRLWINRTVSQRHPPFRLFNQHLRWEPVATVMASLLHQPSQMLPPPHCQMEQFPHCPLASPLGHHLHPQGINFAGQFARIATLTFSMDRPVERATSKEADSPLILSTSCNAVSAECDPHHHPLPFPLQACLVLKSSPVTLCIFFYLFSSVSIFCWFYYLWAVILLLFPLLSFPISLSRNYILLCRSYWIIKQCI